ncbi:hypothetical protein DY000_02045321 [Brassica cretica]|uniref:Uncharacterized protein n=1 Tax=Brassica cretica TaxID=69181 RepID=A0ABQ7F686_BRACR|nr:hypothetical protein DY000_02045321 [Brassica cretica]
MCAIALLIEAKRRKWLEDNLETTTNGFFSSIPRLSKGRAAVIGLKHGFKDAVQEIESEVSCKLEQGKPGMSLDKRFITSLLSLYLLCVSVFTRRIGDDTPGCSM